MSVPAETTGGLVQDQIARLGALAAQLRVDSIRASGKAGSGHPTSSLSAADLMAVLISRHLRYDWSDPGNPANDHLIFSKGHASPLLYSVFKAVGAISDDELVNTYRQFGSRLQGHPTPAIPWVDVATGSLGQGLPAGVGIALAGRHLDNLPYHIWVLCGDSELAEGSIWEALDKAGHYGLGNLTAIVDVNRLGQRGATELEWNLDAYRARVQAFGCEPTVIDGHDLVAIDEAFGRAREASGPTVVLARTVKAKGVPELENREGWHGKPLKPDVAERAIAALVGVNQGGVNQIRVSTPPPQPVAADGQRNRPVAEKAQLPRYDLGAEVATRKAYGDVLVALGCRPDLVVLDGEVGDSTFTDEFAKAHPDRFFEMFISEQQMVAAAVGLQVRGYRPFAATFAAFLSRAFDFIRMAAISRAQIALCGSHAGTEIGADGPSQMGLEDLASFRTIPGSTVLYPCDAVSCTALVAQMPDREGISYVRTTRGPYPVIYGNDERFPIGGSKLLRGGDNAQVALIGAGVTVHNCLTAAERLAGEGIEAQVIDLYSVKPVDRRRLVDAIRTTNGRLIVVEDHYPQGGLGAAVLEAVADLGEPLRITHLAVPGVPSSGKPAQLMAEAGIDADAIVSAAQSLAPLQA